jgi:O-antigen ligase
MYRKGLIEELLIGYLFILILSDSLDTSLVFAKNAKTIYLLLLTAFLFFDLKNFSPIGDPYKIFVPFFIFSCFTMILSVREPFFITSVQKTLSFILIFIVVPSYILRIYRESGLIFFENILLFILTSLLIGFVLKYTIPSIVHIETGRYRGVMGNPNGIGIYCVLAYILFFVINRFYPELFTKNVQLFFLFAIIATIYFSSSRNAIISMLMFLIFQRFFYLSPFLGFILFMVTAIAFQIVSTNIKEIVMALNLGSLFRVGTLESGSGRYIAWEFAWAQIQKNFFIGKGFAYNEYFMRRNYKLLQKLGHQGGIHNSFLTFWMDQGLVGLLIYLRSFILVFIKAAKKTKYSFPIMFTISFTAIFESWLVGSLSAYAFLSIFIFTVITSDEILPEDNIENLIH